MDGQGAEGVILSAAVFQAERRISRETAAETEMLRGRSLLRLNPAGVRDDAFVVLAVGAALRPNQVSFHISIC
jgi:hypothetical protein